MRVLAKDGRERPFLNEPELALYRRVAASLLAAWVVMVGVIGHRITYPAQHPLAVVAAERAFTPVFQNEAGE